MSSSGTGDAGSELEISLDLASYGLDDIAKLFRIEDLSRVGQDDMKAARKIVMMTHPDKSGLKKEYFQFFAKAYERLSSVVDFRNRTSQTEANYREKHRKIDVSDNDSLGPALMKARIITSDGTVGKRWHKWKENFDAWFDQHGELSSNANGYEEFMRSTADLLPEDATEAQAKEFMNNRKANLSAIVKHQALTGLDSWNAFGSRGTIAAGEDLLKAYTETVIPITEDEAANVHTNSNRSIDSLRRQRRADEYVDDGVYADAQERYKKEKDNEERTELAEYYEHLQEFERNKEKVAQFQRGILRLADR